MFSICILYSCLLEMTDPCMAQDNSAPPLSSQTDSSTLERDRVRARETEKQTEQRESGKGNCGLPLCCNSIAVALSLWLMQFSMSNTAIFSYPGGIVSTTAGIPADNFHFKVSG